MPGFFAPLRMTCFSLSCSGEINPIARVPRSESLTALCPPHFAPLRCHSERSKGSLHFPTPVPIPNTGFWCRKTLAKVTLPPSVHLHGSHHIGQRRFYDLNAWSEKKRREKLNNLHGNPVERHMVTSPDQGPWSSFRFYFLRDDSVLPMDRLPSSHTSLRRRCMRHPRQIEFSRGDITPAETNCCSNPGWPGQ